jgi:hypothetical protein
MTGFIRNSSRLPTCYFSVLLQKSTNPALDPGTYSNTGTSLPDFQTGIQNFWFTVNLRVSITQ